MGFHSPWLIEVLNLCSPNHTLKYRFELNQGLIDSAYCCSNLGWKRLELEMKRIAAVAALLIGIQSESHAADFQVVYKWCEGRSPQPIIQLSNVPKGTTKLDVWMTDLDKPNFRHGGGKVDFKNQKTTECGALSDYIGPNPPSPHTYEIEVKALDKDGNKLSSAKATRKFPEK